MDVFAFIRNHWGEIYTVLDLAKNITGLAEKKTPDGDNKEPSAEPKKEKTEPFLGLAGLTRENEQKFLRRFYQLDEGVQPWVAEGLIEYFVKPSKAGFITSAVASVVYDDFMLQVVNLDTPSRSLGKKSTRSTKTSFTAAKDERTEVKKSLPGNEREISFYQHSKPSTKIESTTESEDEAFTPGGTESLKFLVEFGYVYQHGGIQAVDELLKLFRLPTLDPKTLAAIDNFVKNIAPGIAGSSEELRKKIEDFIASVEIKSDYTQVMSALEARQKTRAERREARRGIVGFVSRILN
jgi:hypothetical protein